MSIECVYTNDYKYIEFYCNIWYVSNILYMWFFIINSVREMLQRIIMVDATGVYILRPFLIC